MYIVNSRHRGENNKAIFRSWFHPEGTQKSVEKLNGLTEQNDEVTRQ